MSQLLMPLFVTPEDVILRMQLSPDLTGINDVVTSGIIGAQLHVQRIIDGRLWRQKQNARYFIDAESFSGIAPNGAYRLEIPSGFVRKDTPIILTSSDGDTPFGDLFEVDPSLVSVDYDRGYVHMDARTYANHYVHLQCDTGFDADEPIPNEIYEAIMALVPMVFNSNQTTSRSDEAQKQYQVATDHAQLLLQPYVRTKGLTFRPA